MTDDDGLTFTEDEERSWRAYLRDFREQIYPVFEQHGFTLAEAFLGWQLNRVHNRLCEHLGGDRE